MAYTPLLQLALPEQGTLDGVWGSAINDSITSLLDSAIAGIASEDLSSSTTWTLSTIDGIADEARSMVLRPYGSPSAARTIIAPPHSKMYVVINGFSTAQTVTIKSSTSTGIAIAQGKTTIVVWNDATSDFVQIEPSYASTAGSAAAVTNGGALNTPATGTLTNCTADGTNKVGYKNIPQSSSDKVTAYTLASTDIGKYIGVGTSGSIVVPNATYSDSVAIANGDAISIFNNTSSAVTLTMTITTAYIAGVDSDKATISLSPRGVATILFLSSTSCVVSGNVS